MYSHDVSCHDNLESIYYNGLSTALGIRNNINREIVFIETGRVPISCLVIKRQLNFWNKIIDYTYNNPDSALKKIIDMGVNEQISYLTYYSELKARYDTPELCFRHLVDEIKEDCRVKIEIEESADLDSKLGTYLQINPNLTPYKENNILEHERTIISRFRTGSHSLRIETGRYNNICRSDRLCQCGLNIQTILHVFTDCPLTLPHLNNQYESLNNIFETDNIYNDILVISLSSQYSFMIYFTAYICTQTGLFLLF